MPRAPVRLRNASNSRLYSERVVLLADHLEKSDAALLRSIYDRGMSATEVASVMSCSSRHVQRRVRRLMRRLDDPNFLAVVRYGASWPKRAQRVAELIILHGRSQREAALELDMSLHEIRAERQRIESYLEVLSNQPFLVDAHDTTQSRLASSARSARASEGAP